MKKVKTASSFAPPERLILPEQRAVLGIAASSVNCFHDLLKITDTTAFLAELPAQDAGRGAVSGDFETADEFVKNS